MKINIKLIIRWILILLMVTGLIFVGINQLENFFSDRDYQEAEEIAFGTEPETVEEAESESETEIVEEETEEINPHLAKLQTKNLDALREVNPDVVGWIYIPDTYISYPLVQGTNNQYYLNRTWKKEQNSAGAIFLECQNAADFSDFNTIIYGHNRRNKVLFGSLSAYKEYEYWESHPSVYIANDKGLWQYDIFAVEEAGVTTIIYGLNIESEKVKEEYIRFSLENSVIDTGIVPDTSDKFITLSTCTDYGYSTRWVIQAVLNEEASWPEQTEENGAETETEETTEESVEEAEEATEDAADKSGAQ